jgi:hypothetical protein
MAEETTRQFINRRKRELTFQISALRGQLGSKGEELAELNRTEAALTIAGSAPTPHRTTLFSRPLVVPNFPTATASLCKNFLISLH